MLKVLERGRTGHAAHTEVGSNGAPQTEKAGKAASPLQKDAVSAGVISSVKQTIGSDGARSKPSAQSQFARDAGRRGESVSCQDKAVAESQPHFKFIALKERITAASNAFQNRWARGYTAIEHWCERVDIAPDLASDIGSRKWLRGLATLICLSGAAIAFIPHYDAVESVTATPIEGRERDEFASNGIAPLGLGADSGRQMGPTSLVRRLADVPDRPEIKMVGTLGQGDSLNRMLERMGLGAGDAGQVSQLVSQVLPVKDIVGGTQFDLTLGKRPSSEEARRLESLSFRAKFDLDLSIQRRGEQLALIRHPIRVDETPLRIRGTVGSSLYHSAKSAGAPVSAIQAYLRAIDKYSSLDRELLAPDQFDLIVSYKRSAKGERVVGDLLYAGIERAGRPSLQLMRWGNNGEMYAASSLGQSRSVPLGQPVAGQMTSKYGPRRHPILGIVRMHAGVDYGARHGSPIYAVADGQVVFAGRNGGHGNYVRLRHGGGTDTGYSHMSRIAVVGGSRVRAGQVIGYVGSTGLSTGPHLHFETYRGGRTINPVGVAVMARPQIEGRERDAFMARLNTLLKVAPGAALDSIVEPQIHLNGAEREIDKLAGVLPKRQVHTALLKQEEGGLRL